MNTARAIFLRDIVLELRYRFNLAAKALNSIFFVTVFYFVGALVPAGGYFPFVFMGLAFSRFFAVCVGAGAEMVRNEQYWGTAENLFMSPARPAAIVVSAVASKLLLACAEFVVMALVGVFVFGIKFNALAFLIVPLALVHALMFAGVGLMSAGFVMLYKRGDPAGWLLGILVDLGSGVYFPVDLLPRPVAYFAAQLPTTGALNSWRSIALEGAFPSMFSFSLQCLWAVALFGCGWYMFGVCFNRARKNMSVGSY
jgi:ABC-2 type transport system permease protein